MLTLHIGNKNYSSWSMRPWVLLKHFAIPFREVRHELRPSEGRRATSLWTVNRTRYSTFSSAEEQQMEQILAMCRSELTG